MKISCDRAKLAAAFGTASLFAPTRSPKPILQNIRLDVKKPMTTLMATDMEVGVRVNLEGIEVEKEGSAILPVVNFGAILRESSDEKLLIETSGKGTVVKGARSEFKLPSEDPEEFPAVASFDEKKYHILPASLFRQVIQRTEFATDMESSRYALGGVLVELDGERLMAVGTDGRRLARVEAPAQAIGGHKSPEAATIIRTQSLRAVGRALLDNDGELFLACRANDVLLKTERATYYSRLVEGRFPRWRDVFPTRPDAVKIDIPVGPFHSCLRQAAVVCTQDSRGIDFTFGDGTLTLLASTADQGQSHVEMPISYTGPTISVTLDHRFVSDFLKVLAPEATVTVEIENAEAAAVLYADDKKYAYVVMPLSRDR
jgi:DNA polymerase-3 subunit beta